MMPRLTQYCLEIKQKREDIIIFYIKSEISRYEIFHVHVLHLKQPLCHAALHAASFSAG